MANNEFQELTRNNEKSQFELAGKLNEFTIDSPKTQQEFLNSGKDSSVTKLSAEDFLNDTSTSPKTAELGKDVKIANDTDTAQEGEKSPVPSSDLVAPNANAGTDTAPVTQDPNVEQQLSDAPKTSPEGDVSQLPSTDSVSPNTDKGTDTSPEGPALSDQALPKSDTDTAQESPSDLPAAPSEAILPPPGADTVQDGLSDDGRPNG